MNAAGLRSAAKALATNATGHALQQGLEELLAENARLRAALVEERARFTHMNNYAKNCMPGMPPWDRPSRHDPRDDYRERARAELRAEGLLP